MFLRALLFIEQFILEWSLAPHEISQLVKDCPMPRPAPKCQFLEVSFIMLAELILKKNEDRRLRSGHVWIYSNEIDTEKTSLKNFEPGALLGFMTIEIIERVYNLG